MFQQTPRKRVLFPRCRVPAKRLVFVVFLFAALSASVFTLARPATTDAATASTINFQARLQTAAGGIVADGNYNVQFNLYTANTGGTSLWTETYLVSASQGVRVKNGYLTTNLGSINPFSNSPAINWDQDLYLGITVRGTASCTFATTCTPADNEMGPNRLKLTAVPYAFRAGQLVAGNGTFQSTLSLAQPTVGNQTFTIPDMQAAGNYTLLTTTAANLAYIQNGTTTQGGSNFHIDGNGVIDNNLTALTVNASGGDVAATGNVKVNSGSGGYFYNADSSAKAKLVLNSQGDYLGLQADSAGVFSFSDKTTNDNTLGGQLLTLKLNGDGSGGKVGIGGQTDPQYPLDVNGDTRVKSSTNSTTAFQVQNSSGANIFSVDTTASNYLTNPGVETDLSTWAAYSGGSLVRNTAAANTTSGVASLQWTTSATNPNGIRTTGFSATPTFALSSTWTFSFYAKLTSGSMTTLQAGWNNGSTDTACTISSGTLSTAGFTRYSCTITLTSGQSIASLFMRQADTTSGRVLYVDNVQLVPGSNLTPYDIGNVQIRGVVNSPIALQSNSNSTTAFQVQNAAGNGNNLVVDTLNNIVYLNNTVRIANASYGAALNVAGTTITRTNNASAFQVQNNNATPIFGVNTVAPTANLINNPGFEANTTGWGNKTGGTLTRITTPATALYYGIGSGQLALTGANGGTAFTVAQTLGTTYNLSFYARTSSGTATNISLGYTNTGGDQDCATSQTVVSGGFTRYSCSYTVSGTAGTAVYIKQSTAVTQTLYIDGFQLLGAGATSATPYSLGTIQLRGAVDSAVAFQNANDSTTAFQIQNSLGTSNLFVADTLNSRVNIGTSTAAPSATLTVGGQIAASGPNAALKLMAQDSSGNFSSLYSASGDLTFYTGNNVRALLTAGGNFGVGLNTNPQYPLDVTGDINSSTGYRVAGTAGAAVSCSGGQLLQNAVVSGGIVTAGSCATGGGGGGISTIGTFVPTTSYANGAQISGSTMTFGAADATNPGLVSTSTQTFAGDKTFAGNVAVGAGKTLTTQGDVTVGTSGGTVGFSDGFETNNFSKWTIGTTTTGASTVTTGTTTVHAGTYSAKIAASAGKAYVNTTVSGNVLGIKAWVYVASNSGNADLMALSNGTTNFIVNKDGGSGVVGFTNGVTSTYTPSSTALSTGVWHQIEMDITIGSGTTGAAIVYLDGSAVINQSGINTGSTAISAAALGDQNNDTFTAYYDEVSVMVSSNLTINGSLLQNGNATFGATSGSTATLFSNGFETGDFTAWTPGKTTGGSSTVAVNSTIKHTGTYSAKVTASNAPAYVLDNITSSTNASVSAWVYMSSQTTNQDLLALVTDGPNFNINRDIGDSTIGFWNDNTSSYTDTNVTMATGGWHQLKLDVSISTTNGSAKIYFDGVLIMNQTGINTGTLPIKQIAIGDHNSNPTFTAYFDDIVVSNTNTGSSSMTLNGNFLQNGPASFATGSGAVGLNGDTTLATGKQLQFSTAINDNWNGNAKLFVGSGPDYSAQGNLQGVGILNTIQGYGNSGQGIVLQYGGINDGGGLKLTDDGLMLWGAGDEGLLRIYNEDTGIQVLGIDDDGNDNRLTFNGSATFQTTSNATDNFQIKGMGGTTLFNVDAANVITTVYGGLQVNSNTLGVQLNAADRPLITRGWDTFTSGTYNGMGSWGLFMEPGIITIGAPGFGNGAFQFAHYNANSTISDVPFYIDGNTSSANVGIGTVTPEGNLEIRKDVLNGSGATLVLSNKAADPNANGTVQINFGVDSSETITEPNAQIKAINTNTGGNSETDLVFSTYSGASFNENLRIVGSTGAVTVKSTGPTAAAFVLQHSDGTTALEMRDGGTGAENSFLGRNTGVLRTTGTFNSGFGSLALQSLTSGIENTAVGAKALNVNSTGRFNTAVGYNTLLNNNADANSAFGDDALHSNTSGQRNVAIGESTMYFNTTGNWNTAVGEGALYNNVGGSDNVSLGSAAGRNLTSGDRNTFLGTNTGYIDDNSDNFASIATMTNTTILGAYAQAQASNAFILGGAATEAVNVGIGTTKPNATFSVAPAYYGSYNNGSRTASQSTTTVTGASGTVFTASMVGSDIIFANGTSARITAFVSATQLTVTPSQTVAAQNYRIHYAGFNVSSAGQVGIGTSAPAAALDIVGTLQASGLASLNGGITGVGATNINITGGAATNIGTTGTTATASTTNIGVSTGAAQTVNIGSTNASSAVTINGGTGATAIQIGSGNTAHGIQIGAGGTGTAQTIVIGSVGTASVVTLVGSVNANSATNGIRIGANDASQTNLVLDSSSTYTETASTCSTTVNQGALYYSNITAAAGLTNGTGSIRSCVAGAWEDVVTTSGLGIIMFGVVPDGATSSNVGDLNSTAGYNSGPCKVYMSTGNVVGINSCVAYSGGRKQLVPATTLTVSTTANAYQNLCLSGSNGLPVLVGTANGTETLAPQPTFSVGAPILCLATIKTGSTSTSVSAIYDTRVYTTDTKTPATIATTTGLGTVVKSNGVAGQYAPVSATADMAVGVVGAYSGTVSTTTPNAILVTDGPIAIKSSGTVTIGSALVFGASSGYTNTGTASTTTAYTTYGIAQSAHSAPGANCTAGTACYGSVFTVLRIR